MRDIYKCNSHSLLDILQFVLHILAQAQIECAQRLVEQQHLRAVDQCAGNGHTLLLATGQARHLAVFEALEADDFQHLGHAFVDLILLDLCNAQAEGDVVVHVQMREQRVALEDRVDLALIGGQIVDPFAVEQHVAGRRGQKTADDPEHGRLSAAAGPQQCEEFLVVDVQVDVVENRLSVLECHSEIREANELFGHVSSPISKKFVCVEPCRSRPKHTGLNISGRGSFVNNKTKKCAKKLEELLESSSNFGEKTE